MYGRPSVFGRTIWGVRSYNRPSQSLYFSSSIADLNLMATLTSWMHPFYHPVLRHFQLLTLCEKNLIFSLEVTFESPSYACLPAIIYTIPTFSIFKFSIILWIFVCLFQYQIRNNHVSCSSSSFLLRSVFFHPFLFYRIFYCYSRIPIKKIHKFHSIPFHHQV